MFRILIWTEGNAHIGLGHVNRCLVLAKALRRLKNQVVFACPPATFRKPITAQRFKILSAPRSALQIASAAKKTGAHALVTDSYSLTQKKYSDLRQLIPDIPVLVFDDFGEKKSAPVHGFINPGLAAGAVNYPQDIPFQAAGPGYFLLRDEFKKRSAARRPNPKNRIGVIMGSSDPENQTERIVQILQSIASTEEIAVVLGPLNPSFNRIRELARSDPRIHAYSNPRDLARILRNTRLTVSAAGTTCGELAYLGIPVAALSVADNQLLAAKTVERSGCGKNLGPYQKRTDSNLRKQIQKLIADSRSLKKMSRAGKKLVDGKGAQRLAAELLEFLKTYHQDRFNPKKVQNEYQKSAKAKNEYQKVKWGSAEGMENRFRLGIRNIRWSGVRNWLDIGSGTGTFLELAEQKKSFQNFTGLDLSPALLSHARSKRLKTRSRFLNENFTEFVPNKPFDLVTSVGVLQKCGVPLNKAVAKMAALVRKNGQIFLTTKNKDWSRLSEPRFKAYSGHHWFTQNELRQAARLAGLKITRFRGFEPRTGAEIPITQAHSVYVLLTK